MAMCRVIVIALGVIVSLSQQPGVTWAAADQTPLPAPDASLLTRISPAQPALEADPMLNGLWVVSSPLPMDQSLRSSLAMDSRTAVAIDGLRRAASQEEDPVIWQLPLPTVMPLSSTLILRGLGNTPAGPRTPTAVQILDDEDLAVIAGVRLRF